MAINPLVCDSRPEAIRRSVEGSLERLKTDHIDLCYQRHVDLKVEPEVVAEKMLKLIAEGKILHWGVSEAPLDYIGRADEVCHVAAVQSRYSMMARQNGEMFDERNRLVIGFVAFLPLANGFLSGIYGENPKFDKSNDFRASLAQFQPEAVRKNQELMLWLEDLAQEHHAARAQISLAWMLCKNPSLVPIPGTTKIKRLEENAGAAEIELSTDDVAQIDKRLSEFPMSEVFNGVKSGSGH